MAVQEERVLGITKHKTRHNQFIPAVFIKEYPWDVPFIVEQDGSWFLKTAFPNRKRKKDDPG